MAIELTANELRALGVLIEKSLAQPAYYPMTLSAIVAACNQKTNRDPVTQLTEGEVGAALNGLRQWQLASQAPPERNSRVNRFQHDVEQRFGWNAAQRALMAELLIRGPQTVGELRTHASRMTHLQSTDYARQLLRELEQSDPPMVVELPRQPGRSATRFAHLLGGKTPSQVQRAAADETPPAESRPSMAAGEATPAVEARLNALEQEVIALRLDLDTLCSKLGG
ncbi:MAG: DUF480 domain-containing protein [Phycisphaerae bacterium]|nr:DUF480 domain-containing protein [Phycisphaerae bacterium]